MSVQAIGCLYAAIGAGLAAVVALGRGLGALDSLLMVGLWPMYAPFMLLGGPSRPADAREAALADALARAAASPLASTLPGPDAARELLRRLRDAARRHAELDTLLVRPELAPERIEAHAAALMARGASAAATSARQRVGAIRQLSALRDRYRGALDEVTELTAQLATQVELVRVQPDLAAASVELVCELVARVDALAELADHHAGLDVA